MPAPQPRPIDHLVLPTADLARARARLSALGFTVAPDGRHPFGTANACVYFADGTFLEPLAVADSAGASAAAAAGNVFVVRDARYRASRGEEGFSALVFATADAGADHRAFGDRGIGCGAMLEFSRPFVDASGAAAEARFRLAFAAPAGVADSFAFTCQRVKAPAGARAALERHANGVTGIAGIVAVSDAPEAAARFLAAVAGAPAQGESVAVPGATIAVTTADAFARDLGAAPPGGGLAFAAIRFAVADLDAVRAPLAAAGIAFANPAGRIVVPAAAGQGAVFIFEEPR